MKEVLKLKYQKILQQQLKKGVISKYKYKKELTWLKALSDISLTRTTNKEKSI